MERLLHSGFRLDVDPPHHCVVVGGAGQRLDIPLRELLAAFAQSSAMSCLAAATRCMPIGAAQAQEILARLHPSLIAAAETAMTDPEAAMFTSTPALDIRSHQQASQGNRVLKL